jgi:hypothetical protein
VKDVRRCVNACFNNKKTPGGSKAKIEKKRLEVEKASALEG